MAFGQNLMRAPAAPTPAAPPHHGPDQHHERRLALRQKYRERRADLLLWKRPLATLYHATCELFVLLGHALGWLAARPLPVLLVVSSLSAASYYVETADAELARAIRAEIYMIVYWVMLGIGSTAGMGTGLHTLILFLAPYIVRVTLAAYACDSLKFRPPFSPSDSSTWGNIVCEPGDGSEMTYWKVVWMVQWPTLLWGIGTAIGELPPYFMARAARLSGEVPDDEDMEEFHEHLKTSEEELNNSYMGRAKRFMFHLVQRVGFFGILLCAAIPNPLFDLAGLTCGHFLVPFTTFFFATLIGKAFIKAHCQMLMIVLLMSEKYFNRILVAIEQLPFVGQHLHDLIMAERDKAKANFTSDHVEAPKTSIMSLILAGLVIAMILFFGLSIFNHLAQRHKQRKDNEEIERQLKSN